MKPRARRQATGRRLAPACRSAMGFGADQQHTALRNQSCSGFQACAGLHRKSFRVVRQPSSVTSRFSVTIRMSRNPAEPLCSLLSRLSWRCPVEELERESVPKLRWHRRPGYMAFAVDPVAPCRGHTRSRSTAVSGNSTSTHLRWHPFELVQRPADGGRRRGWHGQGRPWPMLGERRGIDGLVADHRTPADIIAAACRRVGRARGCVPAGGHGRPRGRRSRSRADPRPGTAVLDWCSASRP